MVELGGEAELVVEAFSRKEKAAIRAVLADDIAQAEIAWEAARGTGREANAWLQVRRAHRRNGVIEVSLGTALREQGVASIETPNMVRNREGTTLIRQVRYKRHPHGKRQEETFYRTQWCAPRAWSAVRRYLQIEGLADPLREVQEWPLTNPLQPYGPPVFVRRGEMYAGTMQVRDSEHYPLFRSESGHELTAPDVADLIRGVLRRAEGVEMLRPQRTRHTACDEAVNEWGLSPSQAARVFGWNSVQMVLARYDRGPIEEIWQRLDAMSTRDFAAPTDADRLAREVLAALQGFLAEQLAVDRAGLIPVAWPALVAALDTLADAGGAPVRPSEAVQLSLDEWARITEWIRRRSHRHDSGEDLLGRVVHAGLPVPEPRSTAQAPGQEAA